MCQAGPRWRPNREIAWHTERLILHVRYTNSKRSLSSNAIIIIMIIIIIKESSPEDTFLRDSARPRPCRLSATLVHATETEVSLRREQGTSVLGRSSICGAPRSYSL